MIFRERQFAFSNWTGVAQWSQFILGKETSAGRLGGACNWPLSTGSSLGGLVKVFRKLFPSSRNTVQNLMQNLQSLMQNLQSLVQNLAQNSPPKGRNWPMDKPPSGARLPHDRPLFAHPKGRQVVATALPAAQSVWRQESSGPEGRLKWCSC